MHIEDIYEKYRALSDDSFGVIYTPAPIDYTTLTPDILKSFIIPRLVL